MVEEESNLREALVAEYLRKVAPETARIFQSIQSSPTLVASCKLEDVVEHFSRTAPSGVNQLDIDQRRRRRRRVKEGSGSGEEKVLRLGLCIPGMVLLEI